MWRLAAAQCELLDPVYKYVRGAVGLKFWQALRDLLLTVEEELARYCVLELEVGSAALAQPFPPLGRARSEQRLAVHQIDGVADSAAQCAVGRVGGP